MIVPAAIPPGTDSSGPTITMLVSARRDFRRRLPLRGRISAGLRLHLVAFVLVALLPAAAMGAWAVAQAVEGQRQAMRIRLEDTARAVALALDAELKGRAATLTALAAAPLMDAAGRAHGSWIVVHGARAGTAWPQLVNTLLPCGAPLPAGRDDPAFARALATGQPAVANLFTGPASGRPLSFIVVPVRSEASAAHAISMPIEPRQIAAILDRLARVHGVQLSVVDAAHSVVARNGGTEPAPGARTPSKTVADAAGRASGFLVATTSDGRELAMGFHRLDAAPGWTAVAGIPAAQYHDAWEGPAGRLLAGQLAALAAALVLAAWGSRRLLRPISELTERSAAVAAGRDPIPGRTRRSGVWEFDRLALCIARAHAAMARRVAAQRRALAALARQERRTRALAEAGTLVAWRSDAAGAILEGHGWHALTGQAEDALRGEGWLEALHPEDRARTAAVWAEARAAGRAVDVEYRVRHIGTEAEWRWVRARGVPVRDLPDSPIVEWVGVVEDAHERRSHEERQALLAREVDHRAKNALAVVQAALRLTRAPDVPAYVRAVEGRVAALARAHTLLAEDRWAGADLRAIVAGELSPFLGAGGQGPRAVLEGPDVGLPAIAAQPLGMAVHELATNAVKHGALSAPEGRVTVAWRLDQGLGGAVLRLRWVESGGPAVPGAPRRRGFGSRVLEGTLRGQLGGCVDLAWEPTGLVCEIRVPLRRGGVRMAA